jgi:hypothetical protein
VSHLGDIDPEQKQKPDNLAVAIEDEDPLFYAIEVE